MVRTITGRASSAATVRGLRVPATTLRAEVCARATSSFCTANVCTANDGLATSAGDDSARADGRGGVRKHDDQCRGRGVEHKTKALRPEESEQRSRNATHRHVDEPIFRALTHGDKRRGAPPHGPSRAERQRRCGMRPSSVRRQYRCPSPKNPRASRTQCVRLCPEPGVPYPPSQTLSIARVSRVCRGTSTSVGLGPCPTTTSPMCMCSPFS